MKEKYTVSANIALEKINKEKNILVLKKNQATKIDNNNNNVEKTLINTFILKKKFTILKTDTILNENIFNLNKGSQKLLEIKKITKSLGNRPVLKNISMTLEPGTIVGLLGPNGSGKTTLFNIIIGKIFPDQGSVLLNNEPIHEFPIHIRSQKGLSLLEQHKGLFGNMTAEDNLYAILELHMKNKEEINKKIDYLLSYFNLDYIKKTKANFLSGGEYKRLSILQRICNPNVSALLLDEPCAALDPLSINYLKKFILELKKMKISILITDHNYWAIESILDKAYLIKDGQIIVEGTTEKISNDKNAIKYYLGGNFRI